MKPPNTACSTTLPLCLQERARHIVQLAAKQAKSHPLKNYIESDPRWAPQAERLLLRYIEKAKEIGWSPEKIQTDLDEPLAERLMSQALFAIMSDAIRQGKKRDRRAHRNRRPHTI